MEWPVIKKLCFGWQSQKTHSYVMYNIVYMWTKSPITQQNIGFSEYLYTRTWRASLFTESTCGGFSACLCESMMLFTRERNSQKAHKNRKTHLFKMNSTRKPDPPPCSFTKSVCGGFSISCEHGAAGLSRPQSVLSELLLIFQPETAAVYWFKRSPLHVVVAAVLTQQTNLGEQQRKAKRSNAS